MQIIKYASIIVFVAVFAFFVGKSGTMIEAGKNNKRPQYEIIEFDFKIYTIKGT